MVVSCRAGILCIVFIATGSLLSFLSGLNTSAFRTYGLDQGVSATNISQSETSESLRNWPPLQEWNASNINESSLRRPDKPVTEIMFMIMGEAQYFQSWHQWLRFEPDESKRQQVKYYHANYSVKTTLVYASYDKPVASALCNSSDRSSNDYPDFQNCQTMYIPNTTWTEGRNLLAANALRMEEKRNSKFDYWVFADEDLGIGCTVPSTKDPRDCWQRFLKFLGNPTVIPARATTISIHYLNRWTSIRDQSDPGHQPLFGVSTQDAMLAAFPRRIVEFFLPYATLKHGVSEWVSQACNFCLMKTCFSSSAIYVPDMSLHNEQHRQYLRENFSTDIIMATIVENQGRFVDFSHCSGYNNLHRPDQDKVGPFQNVTEFDQHVPPFNLEQCASLQARFTLWKNHVLSNQHLEPFH